MIVKPSPFEGKGDRLRWMRCKRAMKNPPHQSLRDSFPRRRYAKLRFAMLQHSVLLTSKGKPKTAGNTLCCSPLRGSLKRRKVIIY